MISKYKYIVIVMLLLSFFCTTKAQETTVPIEVQLEILPKILSLNKSFNLENTNSKIHIGILYSSAQRSSLTVKNEINSQLPDGKFKIINAEAILHFIDISNIKELKPYLRQSKIDVLYFTPIRGHDISQISKFCKEEKIISFSGVTSYLDENDISVGFGLDNNKLQITINLESAKAEGADFSSRLLKVSKVK